MTINTNHLQSGNGGIFSDYLDPDRIDILWLEEEDTEVSQVQSKVKFHILNSDVSGSTGIRMTKTLRKSQNYDLEVTFNGHSCNVLLDGDAVGDPIDCSSGFKELTSPKACYTDVEGGWMGNITNLQFITPFSILQGKDAGILYFLCRGKFCCKNNNPSCLFYHKFSSTILF